MTPEGKVKAKLKDLLDEWGCYYFMPVNNGMGKPGLDFFLCANGKFAGIETKKAGVREPTKRQVVTMEAIKAAGGDCYIVTMDERDNLIWLKQ